MDKTILHDLLLQQAKVEAFRSGILFLVGAAWISCAPKLWRAQKRLDDKDSSWSESFWMIGAFMSGLALVAVGYAVWTLPPLLLNPEFWVACQAAKW